MKVFYIYVNVQFTFGRGVGLIIVAYLYRSVLEQANIMKRTVHDLLRKLKSPEVQKSLKLFSLHEINRNLNFTVMGLFSADFSMVHLAFGTMTTYVVLLIQFNVGREESG
ncbi:putative gustatory receptor 28b [Diabrotica undecimpunctata]|uniref:putative gustatory receptor 28b n=1 Tax=Diabrotica undecimpunctata TaxID=50387 RepID=UPI003B63AB24